MALINEAVHLHAKIIWNYHQAHHTLEKSDGILVLGSNDVRVAEYAARLFLDGWAPWLMFSGGLGNFTQGIWDEPEAVKFARIAISLGVPEEKILVEPASTNTGDNIRFSKKMLEEQGIFPNCLILVQKPFMERRTFATARKEWPALHTIVTSPNIPYEEYPNQVISLENLINAMVGDLQRILLYPAKGFQIVQTVPNEVMKAYHYLIENGFNQHLIPE